MSGSEAIWGRNVVLSALESQRPINKILIASGGHGREL
ncbi:MAG: hypothetical protein PWP58_853, partial [Bacillota bacterium]|nr:hypothetical protein [Bacillota bacterium]